MGNYSYWQEEDTELLDEDKYREVLQKVYNVDEKTIQECISDKHYFYFADGWKLQGYWYKEWCRLLLDLVGVIKGTIIFEEEQGFKFWIVYTESEVYVDCVPMTTETLSMKWLIQQAKMSKKEIKEFERKRVVLKL